MSSEIKVNENKTTEQEMDTMEIVLREILEEQKHVQKLNTDQVTAINQLSIQVSSFKKKLENLSVTCPPGPIKNNSITLYV